MLRRGFILLLFLMACSCTKISMLNPMPEPLAFHRNINEAEWDSISDELTVLTFNIQLGFNRDQNPLLDEEYGGTEEHLLALVDAIKSIDPDVVALQEVASGRSNTEIDDQLRFLAEALHMNYAYGGNGESFTQNIFSSGMYGNAILSKYKIVASNNSEIIYVNRYAKRSCLYVDLELTKNRSIAIFNTHLLGDNDSQKQVQVESILRLTENIISPKLIVGDFNQRPDEAALLSFSTFYNDAYLEVNDLFIERIDYIFVDPDSIAVLDVGWLGEEFEALSDHKGYYAKLFLTN